MDILEAIQATITEAQTSGHLCRLYRNQEGYFISRDYWKDWLFQAYPSGRKILSAEGMRLAKEAKEKIEN